MSAHRTVAEVAGDFTGYLERVSRGERFVLTRDGDPIAELAPVARHCPLGDLPTLLASLPKLSPEELDSFEADLARVRG